MLKIQNLTIISSSDPESAGLSLTQTVSEKMAARKILERQLAKLENLSNTPQTLLYFIAYALNLNYLVLSFDPNDRSTPRTLHYYPCYNGWKRDNGQFVDPNHRTVLLFNNKHTFLFTNKNDDIKQAKIAQIKENPQLWAAVSGSGGGHRKQIKMTKRTKKNKKIKKIKKTKKT